MVLPAQAMGRRPPAGGQTQTIKLDSGFAQVIATNKATAVQGGTIADAGLFNGPVMVATAEGQIKSAPARVVIAGNFGADAAPNAAVLDEETSTLKNDLGRIIQGAKGNPQAAAALALLEGASAALKPGKALPLGDRTAGQFYALMEGESADVQNFGAGAVDAFADMRAAAHGVARATSTETRTRTTTVTNDAEVVTTLGLGYLDYLKAQIAAEKSAEEPRNDTPAPNPAGEPSPAPAIASDEARAAAWYPNLPRGGGNNSAVAAGVSKRFLWKPVSDSNGKAAIHTSNAHYTTGVELLDGSTVIETGKVGSIGNGYRPLIRLSKPGSAYPRNLAVRHLPSGYVVVVPDPGQRFEKDGTPVYGPSAQADDEPALAPANPPADAPPAGALYQRTPNSLTLAPALAAVVSRVDILHNVVEGRSDLHKPVAAVRTGNTWTLPQPLGSYPPASASEWGKLARPNTWRLRLSGTPPVGVTYHTSIMQTFIREPEAPGAFYPPSTRS